MNPQDPLAQLKDIHAPAAISAWPPAIGWWILAVLVCVGLGLAIYFAKKYWRQNHYRKVAATSLATAYQQYERDGNKHRYLEAYSQLLRRTALARHQRPLVAGLTGRQWLAFLDKTLGGNDFSQGVGKVITTAPYQPNQSVDIKPLHDLGTRWIKKHKAVLAKPTDQPPLPLGEGWGEGKKT